MKMEGWLSIVCQTTFSGIKKVLGYKMHLADPSAIQILLIPAN